MKKKALFISCFNWYFSRIKPLRDYLVENGYDVTVITADFDHFNKTKYEPKTKECTYIPVPLYKKNLSIKRIISHLVFGKRAGEYLEKIRPDYIYVQMPPNIVGKYCYFYKNKHPETRMIVDLIDLWPESMPLNRFTNTFLIRKWKNMRNRCIQAADYVFTECDLYQAELADFIEPQKTVTLHLFKDQTADEQQLVYNTITNRGKTEVVRFAYLGSMNNIIDIDGICSVLRSFTDKGIRTELHAIGDGASRSRFESEVKNAGCTPFFYGSTYDKETIIKKLAICDYALNMMKESVSVGLTIKSVDYLSMGLPLVNNIKGDTWEIIDKEGIGYNISMTEKPDPLKMTENRDKLKEKVFEVFSNNFTKEGFFNKAREYML